MGFTNQIKVTAKLLNCRLQPSMNAQILGTIKMDEVHNVVAEQNGWGQLENGSWINLQFTAPIEHEENIGMPEVFVTGMCVEDEVAPVVEPVITTTAVVQDIVLHKPKRKRTV